MKEYNIFLKIIIIQFRKIKLSKILKKIIANYYFEISIKIR